VLGLYSYIFIGTAVPGALLTGWLSQVGGAALALVVAAIGLAWYLADRRTAR
jgi:hypothetical protein